PANVTAKAAAGGGIRVTWTLSGGATKYNVYRQTAGGEWENVGFSRTGSFTDSTAAAGVAYSYRIQAQVGQLFSEYSAAVTAKWTATAALRPDRVTAQ
ncbi:MAG: fibronectin type III domain-containing protein, partial [Oscillospiraceae bacterium]|nr:fibronectin type III domain-containing protein [Oscillospiraceae bacterium]